MYFTAKTEEVLSELLHQGSNPDQHTFNVFERAALGKMLYDPYIPEVIRKAMRVCAYDLGQIVPPRRSIEPVASGGVPVSEVAQQVTDRLDSSLRQ